MLHLVGWRQEYDPQKAISRTLTQSDSGLYFQDAHPLLTLENIRAVMPEGFGYRYPEWNSVRRYFPGDKVSHGDSVWIALKESLGETPDLGDFSEDYNDDYGNPYWAVYDYLSDYLETAVRSGAAAVVQTFLQGKALDVQTRDLLERRTFFDGAGRLSDVIDNTHRICGYEIVPVRSMGVTARIERIGLQMAGRSGTVRLYLFHSSRPDPVRTFDLDVQGGGGYRWFDVKDCWLPYMSEGSSPGGSWYLVYDQDDLPRGMEAVNYAKDWSRDPCGSCNRGSVQAWRELTGFLQISPFMTEAPKTFRRYPQLWDIGQNIYTNTTCYGINVEVSVGCDLSDFIISQRQMFATVLQRQVAYSLLRTMAMNPETRVNRSQANATRNDILYELDGNTDSSRPGGLGHELKEAYRALSLNTLGIDRICLTCRHTGISYRTV